MRRVLACLAQLSWRELLGSLLSQVSETDKWNGIRSGEKGAAIVHMESQRCSLPSEDRATEN